MLERALSESVPVLGICFGGQLLARALGARVVPADSSNVGWKEVRTVSPERVGAGPWMFWHDDVFEIPPGADLVAAAYDYPAAFAFGANLGLQFHPEADRVTIERWTRRFSAELDSAGIDRARILERAAQLEDESRVAAWQLFDAFLNGVPGISVSK